MIYQNKIFTKEECEKIIEFSKTYTDMPFREMEKTIDKDNHRIDQLVKNLKDKKLGKFFNIWDIINDKNSEWMFDKLSNWFSNISGVELSNEKIKGCALHKYSKGDLFMKHCDMTNIFSNRRWNLGIQLNDEYIGGEYILYQNEEKYILNKEQGTALAYKSDIEHEITEILEGERWSIVLSLSKEYIIEKRNLF